MDVNLRMIERARGAALRLEAEPTPSAIGLLWGRLLLRCEKIPAGDCAFGLRYDARLYEACWALFPGYPMPAGLVETNIPEGWYAVKVHKGGYDRLEETIKYLVERWLPHGGFRRREGPVLERYLIDPREALERELQTEVCLPVQPDPVL